MKTPLPAYKVIFSPESILDIKDAQRYYGDIRKSLSDRFTEELDKVLISIKQNGQFAAVRYADIRCARIRKFPYLVHYKINDNNRVIILAVYSTYKKPLWEED